MTPPPISSYTNDSFLKAARGEIPDRVPVWLMRQAGRYMPEYRALRAQHTILEMIHDPDLSAEVTLQPVEAFDLDAAIIFADILTLLDEMGLQLEFISGEGPRFNNPIRNAPDVANLIVRPAGEALGYTIEAIRRTVKALDGRIPLIGFSGAPFTLACYAIQGGGSRDFLAARQFMYTQTSAWHALMETLSKAIAEYLLAQAEAGAAALQLFDSWVGMLGPDDYREFVQPYSRYIIETIKAKVEQPVIHFGTDTTGILRDIAAAGGDVIGVDWRVNLSEARQMIGLDRPVQGNMDPMLLQADEERLRARVRETVAQGNIAPGYIFNLGHGIHKTTPPENVAILVDEVHRQPVGS